MRWLYAIIGAVWGGMLALFGSFLAYLAAAFTLSFLFDSPTDVPEWMGIAIKGFCLMTFAAVFLSTVAAGWRVGMMIDLSPDADKVKARERALNLFVVAIIVNALVVGGLGYWAEKAAQEQMAQGVYPPPQTHGQPAQQQGQNGQLSALSQNLHKIISVNASDPGAGTRFINVAVDLDGARHGQYRLEADLSDRVHNAMIVRQHKNFVITPGRQTVRFSLDRDEITRNYAQKVLDNRPDGQQMDIMGDFKLNIRLVPVLSAEEKENLPDYALNSISLGKSELIGSRDISLRLALKFQ